MNNKKEEGVISIIAALVMVVLLGIAAFGIDIGYLFLNKNTLQNAADAAALRGASFLYPNNSGLPVFTEPNNHISGTDPNNIQLNPNTDTFNVIADYWNNLPNIPYQYNSNQSPGPAAVAVTITKKINLFFGSFLGVPSQNITVSAIGIVATPSVIHAGGTKFPFTMGACMYANYWDTINNIPKNDPSTGQPYVFMISSSYQYANNGGINGDQGTGCYSGQWSPLINSSSSDSLISTILTSGNTQDVGDGNTVYLSSGNMANLYSQVNSCSQQGDQTCEFSTIPVVANIVPGSFQPVEALACVHILSANSQSTNKYVLVQMSNNCQLFNGGGDGITYGVYSPPKLAF